jgi:hypothetical protein
MILARIRGEFALPIILLRKVGSPYLRVLKNEYEVDKLYLLILMISVKASQIIFTALRFVDMISRFVTMVH